MSSLHLKSVSGLTVSVILHERMLRLVSGQHLRPLGVILWVSERDERLESLNFGCSTCDGGGEGGW